MKRLILSILFLCLLSQVQSIEITGNDHLTAYFTKEITGKATSETFSMNICVNNPPIIINTDCIKPVYYENGSINEKCNTTDIDGHSISMYSNFSGNKTLFIMNNSGIINVTRLNSSDRGNYTVNVTLLDDGCGGMMSVYTYNFIVNRSTNRAPILINNIPNKKWLADTSLIAYDLNDYFYDPDGDPLTFNHTALSNIRVSISQANVVTYTPNTGFTGIEYITFTATDPYSASASSNNAKLEVEPRQQVSAEQQSRGASGGNIKVPSIAGLSIISCMPEWECANWTECKPQGFQLRECTDKKHCNTTLFRPNLTQKCDYTPTCFDDVKNGNETDVDCGGTCKPCQTKATCQDGIKNGNEIDIDCGGTCKPCQTKATCQDGIKNQDEERVDCGGICKKCETLESPQNIGADFINYLVIILIIIALLTYITYKSIKNKNKILRMWKKIKRLFRKKAMLTKKERDVFLEKLDILEAEIPKMQPFRSVGKLSEIINQYIHTLLEIDESLTNEEILKEIEKLKLSAELKELLTIYFKDLNETEFSQNDITNMIVQTLVYEARIIITRTSKRIDDESFKKIIEIETNKEFDKAYNKITEIDISLLNGNINQAKEDYKKLFESIKEAMVKNKSLYNTITRLYKTINLMGKDGKK